MTPDIQASIDTSRWDSFAAKFPRAAGAAGLTFLTEGGQVIRRGIGREGVERFGREQVQSRMATQDPSRPKGAYVGSIRVELEDKATVAVGPNVPYAWWIERGSQAPHGVPRTHRRSDFIGHRPIERGVERANPALEALLDRLMRAAAEEATQ